LFFLAASRNRVVPNAAAQQEKRPRVGRVKVGESEGKGDRSVWSAQSYPVVVFSVANEI
jgi:hypothetical protein